MALCDRFQKASDAQERRRNRLATASQHQLMNGSNVEDFRKHAHFYISQLPRTTTHPAHIDQLRQTVLSLAVRGFLVPQDSKDEPASELLKRVAAEKARLVKEGKIKEQKPLPPVEESTVPFNLPSGWSWTRLGNLSRLVTSGSRDWARFYANDGAIFVRMGNLSR